MSKEQEALNRIKNKKLFNDDKDIECLQEFITNYKIELEKLNATIQNKNAVINILEKRLNKIPPKDFEEAMKFHRMELQKNAGAIAILQERCSEDEYGSKNYRLDIENVRNYLNDEMEEAVNEVMSELYAYLDV